MKYRTASPWKCMSEDMAKEAIQYMLDERRHPIMVMCKYVTMRILAIELLSADVVLNA